MTKVGRSVLDEYLAEANERVEDDKNRIRILQGLSTTHSLWRLLVFSVTLFFYACTSLAVVVLATIDDKALNALRAATNDELLSAIKSVMGYAVITTVVGVILTVAFTAHRFFRDKKQERVDAEQEHADLVKSIIAINEELLLRHKLIQAENN